jgi:catechol 2,3-dioxygenase
LHQRAGAPRLRVVTLRARDAESLEAIRQATLATGGGIERQPGPATDPAGGRSLVIRDPDGRRFEIVHGDALRAPDLPPPPDQPVRLAHAVLNCHDVDAAQAFLEQALGFVLADRTRIMAFMNCDADHHTLALGITDNDALNHVAFLMPTLDAVMRGGGRMRDAGHAIEWGPGRHGPGNNAFNYFIDPLGIPIEYTAEVEQIDDRYVARGPGEWGWPSGRFDHWGISAPPSARLKDAQRAILFATEL